MALSLFGGYQDPFSQMERMVDRAFERALGGRGTMGTPSGGLDLMPFPGAAGTMTTMPSELMFNPLAGTHPMDIIEKDDHYEIIADAPGMTPEDITIEALQGVLTVRGQHKDVLEEKDKRGRVHRSERITRSFMRSFGLPKNANEDQISATLDRGVLRVHVAKVPEPEAPKPKRIMVGSGGMGAQAITSGEGTSTGAGMGAGTTAGAGTTGMHAGKQTGM